MEKLTFSFEKDTIVFKDFKNPTVEINSPLLLKISFYGTIYVDLNNKTDCFIMFNDKGCKLKDIILQVVSIFAHFFNQIPEFIIKDTATENLVRHIVYNKDFLSEIAVYTTGYDPSEELLVFFTDLISDIDCE